MGFLEILQPAPGSRERVKVPMELLFDVMTTLEKAEEGGMGFVNVKAVEKLYTAVLIAAKREPPRLVVYDECTILIDGEPVECLTTFQKTVLIYIHEAGAVSVDTLLDKVWKKPDGNKQLCYTAFTKINATLEKYGCEIANNGGKYGIEFFKETKR